MIRIGWFILTGVLSGAEQEVNVVSFQIPLYPSNQSEGLPNKSPSKQHVNQNKPNEDTHTHTHTHTQLLTSNKCSVTLKANNSDFHTALPPSTPPHPPNTSNKQTQDKCIL